MSIQIPLFTVLEKYNGSHVTHVLHGSHRLKKTYRIDSLPAYLIFHVKRFTRNNFFIEKNPTIVNFPVKNLELREYLKLDHKLFSEEELRTKSISELRTLLRDRGISTEVRPSFCYFGALEVAVTYRYIVAVAGLRRKG